MSAAGKDDILESGTSLAEYEHYESKEAAAPAPGALQQEHDESNVTTCAAPVADDGGPSGGKNSIASLRERLAADVVTDYYCEKDSSKKKKKMQYTTITSPFRCSSSSRNKSTLLPLVYCDHTASNRPVQSIERYVERVCLPLYGNTHTNTSITGSQTTAFVAEARQIVAEETNAKITGKASLDVVLFAGNGATSAVELLIDCLGLKEASRLDNRDRRPVVFIGPFEHHSNLIPWRESGCEIVMVPECTTTNNVDFAALERLLQKPEFEKRMKMGTFTAASNVTGKVCNVDRIAATLHAHGALAFFDYATASSYTKIDMNPVPSEQYSSPLMVAKDAVFLSPHKMLGGVGTPGVLIVKKTLVSQVNAPSRSGGGTVFYVTNTHHRFLSNRIERYEGGTPNVVGIVRVGLTFLLKRQADSIYRKHWEQMDAASKSTIPSSIAEYDFATYRRVADYLKEHAPNLVLLGSNDDDDSPTLPIFSFLIRNGGRFLHYNYVCAILNDVFGIQSRGGCQCAGPYSQRLLGLTTTAPDGAEIPSFQNEQLEDTLYRFKERAELLRPGYTRLSIPFKGMREAEVDYVLKALVWVSDNGWMLMCQYRVNHRTGEWRHSSRQGKPLGRDERRWLSKYIFTGDGSEQNTLSSPLSIETADSSILEETLANADRILTAARQDQRSIAEASKMASSDLFGENTDIQLEKLRWFVLPKECAELLAKGKLTESTEDSVQLLGALIPHRPTTKGQDCTQTSERTNSFVSGTRKRKPLIEAEPSRRAISVPMDVDRGLMVLVFRDGEHSGEATVKEIADGIDEGELSELCQVFDNVSGDWRAFQDFVSQNDEMVQQPLTSREEFVNATESPAANTCGHKKAPRTSVIWGCAIQPKLVCGHPASKKFVVESMEESSPANPAKKPKPKKFKHERPPPKIMRLATQAVMQWEMIEEGDRLLLGLSGGKDSLSLLHCLLELKRKLPIRFEIEVCTIDPMTPSFDPSPLIPYVESFGLKYHYIRDDIVSRASKAGKDGKTVSSLCSFCARMKRGNLYTCARKNKCNKLVLAQHLDDCAESLMMSIMHNGFLRTMKANYPIDAGDICVIRPLVYCRESLMTEFATTKNLPVINENCPACFEEPKERARVKKLLSREETLYPNFYDNIRRSLIPLMHDDMSGILRSYTEEVVARSRKKPYKGTKGVAEAAEKSDAPVENPSDSKAVTTSLRDATEDELIRELVRRKADRYSVMKTKHDESAEDTPDPTGQVCSLNGGNGTIPCRELME